jgi:hypothetical protein
MMTSDDAGWWTQERPLFGATCQCHWFEPYEEDASFAVSRCRMFVIGIESLERYWLPLPGVLRCRGCIGAKNAAG